MAKVRAQQTHRPVSTEPTDKKGIVATFEDKLVVLRLYSNYILIRCCTTHNAASNHVGTVGLMDPLNGTLYFFLVFITDFTCKTVATSVFGC